jgi:four helix bundle protein
MSVGAHYRESIRARSNNEFISKIECGLQELEETGYWIELLIDSGVVSESKLSELLKEVHELSSILYSIARKVKVRNN